MIRWSYAVPRLTLLGIVVVALWLGLNPLVRWSMVSLGQSVVRAKVQIDKVETSLVGSQLRLTDVRVANPRSPMKNLFQADEILLNLESDSLLRRKLIVSEGRVSGLRIGTDRQTSGELDDADKWNIPLPELPQPDLAEFGQKWLDYAGGILKEEVAKQIEQLQSVQLTRELMRRWPAEYERMEARAGSLKGRIDKLRQLSKTRPKDPMLALDAFQQAAAELEAIEREVLGLRSEIDRLRQQVFADRDAIVQAKDRDIQQIRQMVPLDKLDAEGLSQFLLGTELTQTVLTVAKWVSWGRQHLPAKVDQPETNRSRGVDVLFPEIQQRPDLLIRRLAIDGEAALGKEKFRFEGAVEGLSSEPAVYGKPVVLTARIQGKAAVEMEAILDRTGETPHDQITINCPGLKQPERVLGNPETLAVSVSPGSTHLWVSLKLAGDELDGQILIRQEPVELVPQVASRYGGRRLSGSLQTALEEVREIRVIVGLSGTLEKPNWRLQSNLGPQLAVAVDGLIRRELEARRDELFALLQSRVQSELGRFEQMVIQQQQALFAKLELDGVELQQLDQLIAQRIRIPQQAVTKQLDRVLGDNTQKLDDILGRKLPADLPFRF